MCQVCVCLGARRYAVANANSSYIYILCKMLFYIIHFLQKKFHTFLNVKYFHKKKILFWLMFYIILSSVCHYASQYIQYSITITIHTYVSFVGCISCCIVTSKEIMHAKFIYYSIMQTMEMVEVTYESTIFQS